jgi:D-arabinose 1-dehydrogenase-like Zn-dependent alcohol dehydrogenase
VKAAVLHELGVPRADEFREPTVDAATQDGGPVSADGAERAVIGVLGQIAVQAAKLLGAARVIAAARSQEGLERCLALGADATVRLDGGDHLPQALADAAEGRIDVVLDPAPGPGAVSQAPALAVVRGPASILIASTRSIMSPRLRGSQPVRSAIRVSR